MNKDIYKLHEISYRNGRPCPPIDLITSKKHPLASDRAPWLQPATHALALIARPGAYFLSQLLTEEMIVAEEHRCRAIYPFQKDVLTNNSDPLRWVSLGKGYDWSSRQYVTEYELPGHLREWAKDIASAIDPIKFASFEPDAALVNYYRKGDRLRGHKDDVEKNMEMPLVLVCLGEEDGIFLLGGLDREEEPTPLLLKRGDVLVMSGEARQCVHGVPRLASYLKGKSQSSAGERISISIRQCG